MCFLTCMFFSGDGAVRYRFHRSSFSLFVQAGWVATVARVSSPTILGHVTLSQASKAETIFINECLPIFNTLCCETLMP